MVFPSRHKVVFIHGCFWHRHQARSCKLARLSYIADDQAPHKLELYIVFAAMYDEDRWRDFYAASMRGGVVLPYVVGNREATNCQSDGRCFRMEQAAFPITLDQLREGSRNGFDIMVSGKRSNEAFVKIDAADAVALMKAVGIE